ncbi:MAG TPA: 1-acyl-sn-glycerol-3-phosphate acyltransferase [Leeuwenhoekiella sp.]|nr:1-acyl-sn-glycerol-3-phosphate acyltransferase [Leeuwenhoekiella sp.]
MPSPKKILSYPLSIIFLIAFFGCLVIFHPIQWFCLKFFGYQAHKKSVDYLNFMLMRSLNLLGTTFHFENPYTINRDQPCIIVANHQGPYDIPPIIWYLRKLHPKFISKKELGKGIPSISYNLRHGGSALIDRKDKLKSLKTIKTLTETLNTTHRSVVIFPEGTRSKDGIPQAFSPGGLITLFTAMPDALVIPLTIHNSWKLMRWGSYPIDLGVKVRHIVHEPILVSSMPVRQLVQKVQEVVLADFPEIHRRKREPRERPAQKTDS